MVKKPDSPPKVIAPEDQDPLAGPPVVWTDESLADYEKARVLLDERAGHVRAQEYVDALLVEQVQAEKEWDAGLNAFLEHLKKNGLEVEVDEGVEKMRKSAKNLFDLRFHYKMIHMMGLTRYVDDIMKCEIAKIYRSPVVLTPPDPQRKK